MNFITQLNRPSGTRTRPGRNAWRNLRFRPADRTGSNFERRPARPSVLFCEVVPMLQHSRPGAFARTAPAEKRPIRGRPVKDGLRRKGRNEIRRKSNIVYTGRSSDRSVGVRTMGGEVSQCRSLAGESLTYVPEGIIRCGYWPITQPTLFAGKNCRQASLFCQQRDAWWPHASCVQYGSNRQERRASRA